MTLSIIRKQSKADRLAVCQELADRIPESFRPLAVIWGWIQKPGNSFLLPIIVDQIAAASDTYVRVWPIKSRDFEVTGFDREAMLKVLEDLRSAWAGIVEVTWKEEGALINLYLKPYSP